MSRCGSSSVLVKSGWATAPLSFNETGLSVLIEVFAPLDFDLVGAYLEKKTQQTPMYNGVSILVLVRTHDSIINLAVEVKRAVREIDGLIG